MGSCFLFLLLFLLIETLLLGTGVTVGFLLHWLLPSVDLGIGILTGVVATGFAAYFFRRVMASMDEKQMLDELEREIKSEGTIFTVGPPASGRPKKRRPPR